jgi:hypothetical protein
MGALPMFQTTLANETPEESPVVWPRVDDQSLDEEG